MRSVDITRKLRREQTDAEMWFWPEVLNRQFRGIRLHDEKRTQVLKKYGYRVLRFWNEDLTGHADFVRAKIEKSIGQSF